MDCMKNQEKKTEFAPNTDSVLAQEMKFQIFSRHGGLVDVNQNDEIGIFPDCTTPYTIMCSIKITVLIVHMMVP